LGQEGTFNQNAVVQNEPKTTSTKIISANGYTLNLPNATTSYNVNILISATENTIGNRYSRFVITFNGGNYPATPAVLIEGSARITSTMYQFGD
jgi:hypothetical protein